ncbi:MAG: SRPBCC domain-containing protein [Candidatus Latescibacterota bacterium]|nr:MAG: SRPBCC domain-containing protein [Candidatus Latescibacterota bacterium]
MADIRHMLLIDAPVETVYRAITEKNGLSSWWTVETVAKPEVNSIAEFRFGDRYYDAMQVLELEPNRRVEWKCLEGDKEWVGTHVVFDLEKKGDQTLLRFFHAEWREPTDFFANCNYHWGYYLRSLKLYCETGKGTPFEVKA